MLEMTNVPSRPNTPSPTKTKVITYATDLTWLLTGADAGKFEFD